MKQLKIKTVMVQCKNYIYFKEKGNEHGLCALIKDYFTEIGTENNSFKQK